MRMVINWYRVIAWIILPALTWTMIICMLLGWRIAAASLTIFSSIAIVLLFLFSQEWEDS